MIRVATKADIPAILDIYGPYVLNTTHSFEYAVPTLEVFTKRFETVTAQLPWLVWEEEGKVLGYAYASLPFSRSAYSWDCEVSIYLVPQAQGKGIGRKLYAILETIVLKQGYRVIYSLITSENTGSLAFHEKVGYKTIAVLPNCGMKFGRWLGVVWMEKRSDSVETPKEFPVPWYAIVKNDENFLDDLGTLSLS